MKHLPTFESFVNEAKLKLKPFSKIKVGDVAVDYSGRKGTIIAKGTISEDWEDMKQFDQSGALADFIESTPSGAKGLLGRIEIIAVKYGKGSTEVWTYDEDGAYVTNESITPITEAVNEASEYKDYEKALSSHDWYYQMSDSTRVYDRGEDEVRNIKKIYAGLDDSDKKKAYTIWADMYKKYYPHSDYASKTKQSDFSGI
jgi:hypothetical protein